MADDSTTDVDTLDDNDDAAAADDASAADETKSPYHFVGQTFAGGKPHDAGEMVMLTKSEAEALGDVVQPGKPPTEPTPEEIAKRTAGLYRVREDGGTLCCSLPTSEGGIKRYHSPGDEVQLTAAMARDLGAAVERVD